MKPRVRGAIEREIGKSDPKSWRIWVVDFEDGCGCQERERFGQFATALRFAYHVGCGGSRWEFVA